MKLPIKDIKGNSQGELEVNFPVIEDGRGTQAVQDVVVAYQAAQRMGTACTKTMGEVAGTGKKPWRQKGTGRARAGSFASPLWRGGGVVFGPKPRDFGKKVSRQTRQLALRKALSERLRAGDILLLDDLKLESAKTREFVTVLSALDLRARPFSSARPPMTTSRWPLGTSPTSPWPPATRSTPTMCCAPINWSSPAAPSSKSRPA